MKAAVIDAGGGPGAFRLAEVADPRPTSNEVLIRVEAISIEAGDLASRREGRTLHPHVLGYAAAGTVVEIGPRVTEFQVGQRVTSFASNGSHADLRVAPAATTFGVPDDLDLAIAAAIVCGPGTAALALELARLTGDDTVLVTGATGAVGSAVVQIAAASGARVIGTSRRPGGLDPLSSLGLSDAIVTTDAPASPQVRALTAGRGADILIDTVGGSMLTDGLAALADGGRAVMVGEVAGTSTLIYSRVLMMRRLTVTGCFLGPAMGEPSTRIMIENLIRDTAEGRLIVPVESTFGLSDIAAAHRHAETSRGLGRVVVRP